MEVVYLITGTGTDDWVKVSKLDYSFYLKIGEFAASIFGY